ncbi:glycosyltransferase [Moraxella oblonga]|uniref:glycosyltransferase n=1 Tax=Moraxella oblonga TaxID=200413 RepID=UPI000836E659|nr:glycosyltransferase [Moraxella oblonga]
MSYLTEGNKAMRLGNYDEAISFFNKSIDAHPDLREVLSFNIKLAQQKLNEVCTYYQSVGIIVPVFNALEDVKKCLQSIKDYYDKSILTTVVVVNDGSDLETTNWLRDFCEKNKSIFVLLENDYNIGYTKTVNKGLRYKKFDYLVTLNSDTIVTKDWLKGLLRCIDSDDKLAVVGPLSNAASWQNVPVLFDNSGEFAINEIPSGYNIDEFSKLIGETSQKLYPRLPFINGFCFMIRGEVLERIGYLDEVSFPYGYGEENDLCIRVLDLGYSLAVADDVFVFHAKSKSFGKNKKTELSKKGSENLRLKHGVEKYNALVNQLKATAQLDLVRKNIKTRLMTTKDLTKLFNFSIVFLLPVKGGGGGSHSVVQEVSAMRRLGVDAKIAVNQSNLHRFFDMYPNLQAKEDVFVGFQQLPDLISLTESADIVVATVYKSVGLLKNIINIHNHIMPAYYIQDYEPKFFKEGTKEWEEAYNSYTAIPNIKSFAKTHWICEEVHKNHGISVSKVEPSIDHSVYYLRDRSNLPMVISAMIRPQTPYRGAERSMLALEKITQHYPSVKILIFGCDPSHEFFNNWNTSSFFENKGILNREQVAEVLSNSDIFIDLSDYQAFGRTGLEAMASGATVVSTKNGGVYEYAKHEENCLLVDPYDQDEIFNTISRLIKDEKLLNQLRRNAAITASKFSIHRAAISELNFFAESLTTHLLKHKKIKKKTLALVPAMRRDGIPAGSGYVRVVLPYTHANIQRKYNVKVYNSLPNINDFDIALAQRDMPTFTLNQIKDWVYQLKKEKKTLIYEIDDNLLDEPGLLSRGFKGDFISLRDKVLFLAKHADQVYVSTRELLKTFKNINTNVVVVPNLLDENLWKFDSSREELLDKNFPLSKDNVVRIGYIGTSTHFSDLKEIENAIKAICQKYGNLVSIEIIGAFQNTEPFFGKRIALPKSTDYISFVNWLQKRVNWDIGIIPLCRDEFNQSKSNLKFLEYSALRLPVVVSNHSVYESVAMNEQNALVANTTEEWIHALSRLIESKSLRDSLSKKARHLIESKFLLKNYSHPILELEGEGL